MINILYETQGEKGLQGNIWACNQALSSEIQFDS